ncbi:MAG: peroxiredoxin [Myxococcota bacterium]
MVVWGIASADSESDVATFAEQYGITFPLLIDNKGVHQEYAQQTPFPSAAYPQDWVIGADGTVVYVNNGFELDAMLSAIESELD